VALFIVFILASGKPGTETELLEHLNHERRRNRIKFTQRASEILTHSIALERLGTQGRSHAGTGPTGSDENLRTAFCVTAKCSCCCPEADHVERHGSQLSAWSGGENGALFQLVLPIEAEAVDADAAG
jgi:hypothetical protein